MVGFLLARGADPGARLPANPSQSVTAMARSINSPFVGLLEGRPVAPNPAPAIPLLATNSRALRLVDR